MLNKYLRSTIIVMIQGILPLLAIIILTLQLVIHVETFQQTELFLQTHRWSFFIGHSLFYLMFYFLWPVLVNRVLARQQLSIDFIHKQTAISARWYLLAIMAFFEVLNGLR